MGSDLPLGIVTFLMTDVEASTAIWRDSPSAAVAMERQAELIANAVRRRGGVLPADQGEGDSSLAAFVRPSDALAAALDAQRALAAEPWPESATVRVRMSVHSGEAELRGERNYGGLALIRCARLRALAQGGQILVSEATCALTRERLPEGAALVPIESIALDALDAAEAVHELRHRDLPSGPVGLRRTRASRLPAWPTPLIGRARELRELSDVLTESRLVTLTGVGGSGKTRLALAAAEQARERFADGAVWIELAQLSAAEQVVGAVIAACGIREVPGVPALQLLARHLAERESLVVLDNCEHLPAACAELADAVVRATARVRVLATSREPLGATGETVWRVPSLALPGPDDHALARIAECDAVALFVARARAARGDFRLDSGNAAIVARICQRLDGVPLALELAAARVGSLSLERLAAGLDDRFRLLTGGARNAIARQRTLLASVEWSHDLLDEEERALFRRLAVFAAPFALEAAEAVAVGDDIDALSVFDVLARLVDKSLVQHSGDRYRLLETLRQYALERADEAGELAELRDRHLEWFQRHAAGWQLDREVGSTALLADVTDEYSDLVSAAEWGASRNGRLPREIVYAIVECLMARESFEEARTIGLRLLAPLPVKSRDWLEGLAPFAQALLLSGEAAWFGPASEALSEGVSLDPIARGFLECVLLVPRAFLGEREAQEGMRRIAEVGRLAGNALLESVAQLQLAILLSQIGDVAGARPLLAWLDRRVARDAPMRVMIEMSHVMVASYTGEFERALKRIESLEAQAHSDRFTRVVFNGVVGFWTCDAETVRRSVDGIARVFHAGWSGFPHMLEAFWHLVRRELDAAAAQLEQAETQTMFANFTLWTRALRAEVAFARGDVAAAQSLLREVQPQLAGGELHYIRSVAELLAAHLARDGGERLEAESIALATLANAQAHELRLVVVDALELLAVLAGDRGDLPEAGRRLGAASAFRERTGYRWQPEHQRRAVEDLRERVPDAALAEGASLSLDQAASFASRGRGERGRPDHGWESLTPSELRVVELVAAGLPNAAIAKQLFVSLATVKTHLVHVYGKLGLGTRAELAAAATKRNLKEADDARPL